MGLAYDYSNEKVEQIKAAMGDFEYGQNDVQDNLILEYRAK